MGAVRTPRVVEASVIGRDTREFTITRVDDSPMKSLTPNLMVEDVRASVEFYEQFGFDVRMAVPEGSDEDGGGDEDDVHDELAPGERYVYAQITAGDVELMLQEAASLASDVPVLADADTGGSCTLYVQVEDVDSLYESVADDAEILVEPNETWYGMYEFYVRDPDGYVLGFAAEAA